MMRHENPFVVPRATWARCTTTATVFQKTFVTAYTWLNLAAAQGNKIAKSVRDSLAAAGGLLLFRLPLSAQALGFRNLLGCHIGDQLDVGY